MVDPLLDYYKRIEFYGKLRFSPPSVFIEMCNQPTNADCSCFVDISSCNKYGNNYIAVGYGARVPMFNRKPNLVMVYNS